MKWWEKYKDYIGSGMKPVKPNVKEDVGFNVGNILQVIKSFIVNMFVDIQEGENPGFAFNWSKIVFWVLVIAAIILVLGLN